MSALKQATDAMSVAEICDKLTAERDGLLRDKAELVAALQWIMLRGVRQQAEGGDTMDFQDASREQSDRARYAIAKHGGAK